MSLTTNYGYDYVFELASRLSPVERERLARSITGNITPESSEKHESFLPESDDVPYSPEMYSEFLLRGPVIDEKQIQLMLGAREEVNRCRPISW